MSYTSLSNMNLPHSELQIKLDPRRSLKSGADISNFDNNSEGELNSDSANTCTSSSTECRIRKQEPLSSKSRSSVRNMIEFEEFVVDGVLSKPTSDSNEATIPLSATRNSVELTHNRKNENPKHNDSMLRDDLKTNTSVLPSYRSEYQTPGSPKTSIALNKTNEKYIEREHDNSLLGINRMSNNEVFESFIARQKGIQRILEDKNEYLSDRIINVDELSSRNRQSKARADETTEINKSLLMITTDIRGIKDDMSNLQKEMKNSEIKNKNIEEFVLNQSTQTNLIIEALHQLKSDNGALKGLIESLNVNQNVQPKENKEPELNSKFAIELAISKKSLKFHQEELKIQKGKYKNIVKNQESVINDLRKQLQVKIHECEKQEKQAVLKREDTRTPEPQKSIEVANKPTHTKSQATLDIPITKEGRGSTPSHSNRSSEMHLKFPKEELKGSKSTRNLKESSNTDLEYIKHMEYISEKINEGKKKKTLKTDEINNPQKDYSHGLPPHPAFSQTVQDEKNKKAKEPEKIEVSQNLVDDTSFEEDQKKTLVDISFDTSFLKENQKKNLDEMGSPNMSPIKDKGSKARSMRSKNQSQQNFSQINEMSTINEQITENFVTDSIHTKIISELQCVDHHSKKTTLKGQTYHESARDDIRYKEETLSSRIPAQRDNTNINNYKNLYDISTKNMTPHQKEEIAYYRAQYMKQHRPEQYFSNPSINTENNDLAQIPFANFKTPTNTNMNFNFKDATLSTIEKQHSESYSQLPTKSGAKTTKSASSSQTKLFNGKKNEMTKEKLQYFQNYVDEYANLQNYNNNTLSNLNEALEKMIMSTKNRDISVPKNQPKENFESEKENDEYRLPDSRSKSASHKRIHSNTNYSQVTKQNPVSPIINPSHSSYRINQIDVSDKENFAENYIRGSVTTTNKTSRKNLYNFNENEQLFTTAGIVEPSPHSKVRIEGQSKQQRSNNSSRTQTPNNKIVIEASHLNDTRYHNSKSSKRSNKTPLTENNSQLNSFEQNSNKKSKQKIQYKPPSSGKPTPEPQLNELNPSEYFQNHDLSRNGKVNHYLSSYDQVNYESLHPNELEEAGFKFSREEFVINNDKINFRVSQENNIKGNDFDIEPSSKSSKGKKKKYNDIYYA